MSQFVPVRPYVPRPRGSELPAEAGRFVLNPPYVQGRAVSAPKVEQLPSIDEFLDRSPPIEQFAPDIPVPSSPPALREEWPAWGGAEEQPAAPAQSEWGRDDWQSYDWGAAANLGSAPLDPAAQAWASTDWSEPTGSREARHSAAEALAQALDQIARRIRTGELRVPGPDTAKDDAAIAGTLAALLGIRR